MSTVSWRKSSHSHSSGECVEVAAFPFDVVGVRDSKDPGGPHLALSRDAFRTLLEQATTHWRKSTYRHDTGECVEVAAFPSGDIGVRDSKNPGGPHLMLSGAFRGLLDQAAAD